MANLAYFPLTNDLIEGATVLVVTEDGDYPQENIQNIPMADTARATEDTTPPGNIVRVRIDFGAAVGAVNPRAWFFLNHNIAGGNWEIHRTNAAWASAEQQNVTYREFDTKFYGATWAAASQYFEVIFPAACTYKDAFWEMGKIIAGLDMTEFSRDFSPGIERGLGFRNVHLETEYGVTWDYVKQENINYLGFKWDPDIKLTLLDELLAFIRLTKGGAYPSVIIPNKDKAELYYMKNQDRLNWREEMARSIIRKCVMNFVEMSRGKITAL